MMWRHIMSYIPVNLANLLVSFGGIIILTRLFDAAEFGLYSLIFITLQFSHMAIFTWVEAAMARFHARAEREGNLPTHLMTCYGTAVVMAVIGAALFFTIILLAPISTELKTILAFALGSTALQTIVRVGLEAHKAAHRIGRFSFVYSTHMLVGFSVGVLLIITTPLKVAGPFAGLVVANIICLAIDLPLMLRRAKGGKIEWDRTWRYAAYGLPICFSLLLELALSAGDRYLIAGFLGQAEVGEYSAGYGLAARGMDVLFVWLGMAATPIAITALERDGLEHTREVLRGYGGILLLVTLPAAVGLALVARPLCEILIGESVRAGAIEILPWITAAGVMNGLITYYVQRAFMLSGRTGMMAAAMIIPAALNIALNIWWLPIFGLMGAVYATLVSYAVGLTLAMLIARRYFPLPVPVDALIKCGMSAAAMAAVVINLPGLEQLPAFWELTIKALVGASVYAGSVLLLDAAESRSLLHGILGRFRKGDLAPEGGAL